MQVSLMHDPVRHRRRTVIFNATKHYDSLIFSDLAAAFREGVSLNPIGFVFYTFDVLFSWLVPGLMHFYL